MIRHSIKTITICFISLILGSCGGGGGSSPATVASTTYNGIYFDAPTKGLKYSASPSGLSGTTDVAGAFNFRAGDTVTFSIDTSSGVSLSAGSVTPITPVSATTTFTSHVLSLENGVSIARVLQSLDSRASSNNLDVSAISSDTSYTSSVSNSINKFVSSNGAVEDTAATNKLTVSSTAAMEKALDSIANISTIPLTDSISTVITGSTYAYSFKRSFVLTSVSYTASGSGLLYFSPTKYYSVCSYFPLTNTATLNFSNTCSVPGVNEQETWSASTSSNNTFSTGRGYTINVPILDSRSGSYSSIKTTDATDIERGVYIKLLSTFSLSNFAGKVITIYGFKSCTTDGKMNVTFNAGGTAYTKACSASTTGSFSPSGVASMASSSMPGIVKLTDLDSSVYYLGITNTSSSTSGTVALATSGNTSCTRTSLANCASMTMVKYTVN